MADFEKILPDKIEVTSAYKVINQQGNLVYEYNPFRNYRLSTYQFEYKNYLYSLQELKEKFGIILLSDGTETPKITDDILNKELKWKIKGTDMNNSEAPILRRPGELVDFVTDQLKFNIHNPVNLIPQYSYDNSVNLIINDGYNPPRLINSRFSALGKNKYQIVDRKGDNDTNIYDQGAEFDIDTSLYKKTNTIPVLSFIETFSGGYMPIGNYHFYFKYMDADGNESDFIAESGLVSIFIGNEPLNIKSGFRQENSYKGILFSLSNLDPGYQYISIYYTVATSDIDQNAVTTSYKIDQKYLIGIGNKCTIKITGYEDKTEITTEEINLQYQVVGSAEAQEQCQNMLFLGNVQKPNIDYTELEDLSLRFVPTVSLEDYDISSKVNEDYDVQSDFENSYYNTKFIYNKVGYYPGEIYRLGIVYILKDNTLSPVFNIRGKKDITDDDNEYSKQNICDGEGTRLHIAYNEETFILSNDNSAGILENAKGVISISNEKEERVSIYGLNIKLQDRQNCIKALQDLGIRGYFFVRQKRIPTTLCEAFVIGVDKQSHTPVIPYNKEYISESFLSQAPNAQMLSHEYMDHIVNVDRANINTAAICPEYDINSPYLNTLFNGDKFTVIKNKIQPKALQRSIYQDRHYYTNTFEKADQEYTEKCNIVGVEDNTKLIAIQDTFYSARAGEAEEAFRYEYIKYKNKITKATNLLRGSFGPFLGMKESNFIGSVVTIKIPNYKESNMEEYFKIRYSDQSAYYAISDRYSIDDYKDRTYYRGDCYICQVTHRVNRNFQDPTAPTNDMIVDEKCWKDNYKVEDGVVKKENFDKINLGDVNAVQLGQWVTFTVRSSFNLSIRAVDDSNVDEAALTGVNRSFYPNIPLSTAGVYKIPEALCYNKGFQNSTSERLNFIEPDIPALKNDFTNRILYSDINVNDAFKNGFRTFQGTHYRDYPKTYGQITKLVEFRGNLICVFEHGIALIPVNERVIAGEGAGGNVFINTSNVLPENPKIISDTFGSQWKDSVIKTPLGIYGVDTIGKKIWRTNGENFECISDFRVQEFLNQNISLSERELEPVIGVRNVKTHYNKFKRDVMFTFYDNLYGFEEKVWNLCYNELQQKWITFYSWVPSYSENIYSSFFSFDRNTSKWITKLGISNAGNDFSDGVTLSNNIIPNSGRRGYRIGELSLSNRQLPQGEGISYKIKYSLQRDNFGNWKKFEIKEEKDGKFYLCLKPDIHYLYNRSKNSTSADKYTQPENLLSDEWRSTIPTENAIEYPYVWRRRVENNDLNQSTYEQTDQVLKPTIGYDSIDLCSELYKRYNSFNPNEKIDDLSENSSQIDKWKTDSVLGSKYKIAKDENGRRQLLFHSDTKDCRRNPNTIVYLLNIKAEIEISYEKSLDISLSEAYASGFKNGMKVDGGYYESVVAVIPQYNMQFLTTDFWKHGQAGIIDIADKIYPTHWYGKQHPFEFEFIVADNPQLHKIFDNLEIISNNAEPESFHYEIIGDCYEFAKDKKNMYIRQEATKELYQYNGSDILFDSDYVKLDSEHRKRYMIQNGARIELQGYDKSTLFPLYYQRQNDYNNIEDYYHLKDGTSQSKDFSALSGAEIVRYDNLQEYRIWNHAKAINIADDTKGRIRGNMQYKEDKWCVQINPINLIQKNEPTWVDLDNQETDKVPVELNQNPLPDDILNPNDMYVPSSFEASGDSRGRGYTQWEWKESDNKEVKIKDKWIKIRVRYKGDKLAIITAIRTLYSISYS